MYKLFFLFIIVLFISCINLTQIKFNERFENNNPYFTRKHKRDLCKYDIDNKDSYNKLSFDLCYIKNQNLILDLYIFFRTIKVIFNVKGSKPIN